MDIGAVFRGSHARTSLAVRPLVLRLLIRPASLGAIDGQQKSQVLLGFLVILSLPELEVLGGFLQYARYCSRSTYQRSFKVFSGFLHAGRQSNLRVESPSKQDVSGQCQINR
jgi:hypothetical protein